jgi:hypothetical protein
MSSALPIMIMVVVCCCCCLLVAGGGGYYLWDKKKKEDEAAAELELELDDSYDTAAGPPPEIELPTSEVVTNVTAAQCQAVNAIDRSAMTGCTNGKNETGVTWNWGKDNTSQACKNATAYYEVTASSSYLPNVILKQTIKGGTQNTTGIKGMMPIWHEKNVTFSVMPQDKDKKNLMQNPVTWDVTQATDNQSCATAGVNALHPVPIWNENNNLIDVGAKSTNGAQGGLQVNTKDDKQAYWSGYTTIGTDNRMVVPEGFRAQTWCQMTGNYSCTRWRDHPWEELKKKQVDGKVNYSGTCWANCMSGGL